MCNLYIPITSSKLPHNKYHIQNRENSVFTLILTQSLYMALCRGLVSPSEITTEIMYATKTRIINIDAIPINTVLRS